MTDSSLQPRKLQWKWIGITFAMYLLFYILPIFILMNFFAYKIAVILSGAWIFGGIILIAVAAGYLSPGVTIWEPAIAGAGLFLSLFALLFFYMHLVYHPKLNLIEELFQIVISTLVVFLLSLLGAWLGERAQKVWKTKAPEEGS